MHSETGEDILTFDVADEALERAAAVMGGRAMTIVPAKIMAVGNLSCWQNESDWLFRSLFRLRD
jgi:hypothetical protein